MAAPECSECSRAAGRPTKLGVGWCANCVKAVDSGVEVSEKRDRHKNPRYFQHVPGNVVAVYQKALSKVHKKNNTVVSKSIASPSKLANARVVPARLPPSHSPEPSVVPASTLPSKRNAAPYPKHPTKAARDAEVAIPPHKIESRCRNSRCCCSKCSKHIYVGTFGRCSAILE
jgi:hypothetical protein